MSRWVVALLVVGVVLAPGAAGAKTAKAPKVQTAAELAAVIAARGLGCDPFVDADDTQRSSVPGGPPVGDNGECPVNAATASIAVYENARELGRSLAAMPTICRFAVAVYGPVEFTFVTGRNWSVSFFSEEYEPAVGKALGGKVREIDCTKVAGR